MIIFKIIGKFILNSQFEDRINISVFYQFEKCYINLI